MNGTVAPATGTTAPATGTTAPATGTTAPASSATDAVTKAGRGPAEVAIVFFALLAIVLVAYLAMNKYGDASEKAVAVLGIVVTPLATIGAAAFGISTAAAKGAEAGAAAGDAKAKAAENEKDKEKSEKLAVKEGLATQVAPEVKALKSEFGTLSQLFENLGESSSGSPRLRFYNATGQPGAAGDRPVSGSATEIPLEDFSSIRERLTRLDAIIGRLAQ